MGKLAVPARYRRHDGAAHGKILYQVGKTLDMIGMGMSGEDIMEPFDAPPPEILRVYLLAHGRSLFGHFIRSVHFIRPLGRRVGWPGVYAAATIDHHRGAAGKSDQSSVSLPNIEKRDLQPTASRFCVQQRRSYYHYQQSQIDQRNGKRKQQHRPSLPRRDRKSTRL